MQTAPGASCPGPLPSRPLACTRRAGRPQIAASNSAEAQPGGGAGPAGTPAFPGVGRRAASRAGEVQGPGFAVPRKLCWSSEKLSPGPCALTRRRPLRPGRPCPAPARIRRATVRPSGPRGNCARRPPLETRGGETGRESPPLTRCGLRPKTDGSSLLPPLKMQGVDLFAGTMLPDLPDLSLAFHTHCG